MLQIEAMRLVQIDAEHAGCENMSVAADDSKGLSSCRYLMWDCIACRILAHSAHTHTACAKLRTQYPMSYIVTFAPRT